MQRYPEDGRPAHQVEPADPDHWRLRVTPTVRTLFPVRAQDGEADELHRHTVGDVDVDRAHHREHRDGQFTALDLRLPQVDIVTAHDGNGAEVADRAERSASAGPAHDGHRLADRPVNLGQGRGLRWR